MKRNLTALAVVLVIYMAHGGLPRVAAQSPAPDEAAAHFEPYHLEPAGAAPDTVSVRITGGRVDENVYLPLAEAQIRRQIRIQGGTRYIISMNSVNYVDPPRPGGTGTLTIPVKIWGAGYRTVRKDVIVRVENMHVEGFASPDRIYVSNSPESLTHSGELLSDTLHHGTSSRFMIHHRNATERNLNFVFFISNPNGKTAVVRVIGDILGVWNKELQAGHDATERFMKAERDGVGYLLEVPAGGYATLKKFAFEPGQIVSGLCEVQVLRGQGIDFSVRVLEPYLPDKAPREEIGDFYSNRAHGYFATPLVSLKSKYVIGDRWKFLSVGDDPLPPLIPDSPPLYGNYGVTYDITVSVENPGIRTETVDIKFAPAGGVAMGTFFVDDAFTQTGIVKPPHKTMLHSVSVDPGETRHVRLVTIPESGSYYPVRIIVGQRLKGY